MVLGFHRFVVGCTRHVTVAAAVKEKDKAGRVDFTHLLIQVFTAVAVK